MLGYIVPGTVGNLCMDFGISSHLKRAGQVAWPRTVEEIGIIQPAIARSPILVRWRWKFMPYECFNTAGLWTRSSSVGVERSKGARTKALMRLKKVNVHFERELFMKEKSLIRRRAHVGSLGSRNSSRWARRRRDGAFAESLWVTSCGASAS